MGPLFRSQNHVPQHLGNGSQSERTEDDTWPRFEPFGTKKLSLNMSRKKHRTGTTHRFWGVLSPELETSGERFSLRVRNPAPLDLAHEELILGLDSHVHGFKDKFQKFRFNLPHPFLHSS